MIRFRRSGGPPPPGHQPGPVIPIITLTLPATAGQRDSSPGEDATATTADRSGGDPLQAVRRQIPQGISPARWFRSSS